MTWQEEKEKAFQELERTEPRVKNTLIGGFMSTIIGISVGMIVLELTAKSLKKQGL